MRPRSVRFVSALLLLIAAQPRSPASDISKPPAGAKVQRFVSADDFDWRDTVSYLFAAANLPGEQGIKAVLENSPVLRAYVAGEIRAECRSFKSRCTTSAVPIEEEVSKRIDQIVQEGTLHQHKTAYVDYTLSRRPFPFSEISVARSDQHADAYLMLAFADRSYTAADLQAKYGEPYDTNVFQWYSVFQYRVNSPEYASKAIFEVDPTDGAVIKLAISLKIRKAKK